jgi:hypothetical protein
MTTYRITLDIDALDSLCLSDADIVRAFLALGADADARFTNARVVPSIDTHAFARCADVAFDATDNDIARYLAYYDAPEDETIMRY